MHHRPPFRSVLGADGARRLDRAARRILDEVGIVFDWDQARDRLAAAGARVVEDRVYLDDATIDRALAQAPDRFTLHSPAGLADAEVGGGQARTMPVGGAAFAVDLDGVRRPGRLCDLADFSRLSAAAAEIDVQARKAVEAQDVAVEARHVACWTTLMRLCAKPIQAGMVLGAQEAEDVLELLAAFHGGEDAIRDRPVAQASVNVNSPLRYDQAMTEGLARFAEWGQPVKLTPFVMAGLSGPSALAGALAQHNAEVLAGLVLVQAIRPGTPVLYGCATSNLDLRTGMPASASPESARAVAATAELARFYGLPSRGGGALTDSSRPDAQSQMERALALANTLDCGVDFIMHAAGGLEAYLTSSKVQFVVDLEILRWLAAARAEIDINDETLRLDEIARVGPGGQFIDTTETLAGFETAFWQPRLAQRASYEQMSDAGAEDMLARATTRAREMIESHALPEYPDGTLGRLENAAQQICRRRGLDMSWEALI